MRSISIRGVDDQLAALLKQEALALNKSVNQLVLETLKKHVGLEKKNYLPSNITILIISLVNGQKTNLIKFKEKSILNDKLTKNSGNVHRQRIWRTPLNREPPMTVTNSGNVNIRQHSICPRAGLPACFCIAERPDREHLEHCQTFTDRGFL